MEKLTAAAFIVIALAVSASLYAAPMLPETVPSHWGTSGQVNGYSSKGFVLVLVPAMMLVLTPLLLYMPRIDPLRNNYMTFQGYYSAFIVVFNAFMLYVHVLVLSAGLGYGFNMNTVLTPAFSLLFMFIGLMLGKAKRNWFMGIRTPWTMSSDEVWDSTHRVSGRLFIDAGVTSLLGVVFPSISVYLLLASSIGAGVGSVAISYYYYAKLAPKNKQA